MFVAEFNLSISNLVEQASGFVMPVDLNVFTNVNDRSEALRAYNNIAGNDFDRLRSNDNLWHFGLSIGYEDFF